MYLRKHRRATRTRFSSPTAPVCCVLLNHNTTVFLNRKALPTNPVKTEKSSTLNAGILAFIKAEDAGGLAPAKDDNIEKEQKTKFKACSYGSPMLKQSSFSSQQKHRPGQIQDGAFLRIFPETCKYMVSPEISQTS